MQLETVNGVSFPCATRNENKNKQKGEHLYLAYGYMATFERSQHYGLLTLPQAVRCVAIQDWRKIPVITSVSLVITLVTFIFVVASAIIQNGGWDEDSNIRVCTAATLVCLTGYATNKKVNFMLDVLYIGVCITTFIYRFGIVRNDMCFIGIQKNILIIPVTLEVVINSYTIIEASLKLDSFYSEVKTLSKERVVIANLVRFLHHAIKYSGEPGGADGPIWRACLALSFDLRIRRYLNSLIIPAFYD
ncbi:hypothetical protein BX600DRAFT_437919 [Xylariales sp. PMI_506]|nr:hypothetical protein BX600DRAFT_437919 [Xylariales sp. PMI_506]